MVLLAIILPGIVTAVLAIQMWHEFQALSQAGITTQGTVTDLSESSDADGTSYYVHYRFVANDHFYIESDSVSYDDYKTLELGQQVTIRYAANDPTVSHFGAQDSPLTAIFLTLFSLVWNGFLVFGFLTRKRSVKPQASI